MECNVRPILDLANEYICAENDLMEYVRKHKEIISPECSYLNLDTEESRILYETKTKASFCYYASLQYTCKAVEFDIGKVLALSKAMRRYEQRNHWQVCTCLPWDENRVAQWLQEDDMTQKFYVSTGRKKNWIGG